MAPPATTMDSSDQLQESIEQDGDVWAPVQRERSYTTGSLSESSGLKRRKQGESLPTQTTEEKEPSNKRVKPVTKSLSANSTPQPAKNTPHPTKNTPQQAKVTPLKKLSLSIQRSIGSRNDNSLFSYFPRTRSRESAKKRSNKLWSETYDSAKEELSTKEIKRQEVIFELMQGEHALIEDLNLVKKVMESPYTKESSESPDQAMVHQINMVGIGTLVNYYEPMLKLSIMTQEELSQIFGILDPLPALHRELLDRLQKLRREDGTLDQVGPTMLEWLPCLGSYKAYCCQQVSAKALLDHKRRKPAVHNFLQLCQESSFSRKLDVWSFLDLPRSRLVKYPLLLKEILKHTSPDHLDCKPLGQAVSIIQTIIGQINTKAGEAECEYYKKRLCYLYESQNEEDLSRSGILHCHGELKNNKGQRLHVFLFERILVLTRLVTHDDQPQFQVYRQPIPLVELVLEDLPDGEARVGGSIRGAFIATNERAKNIFRVSFQDRSRGQAHALHANDAFNKQQWVSCIRQAMVASREGSHSLHKAQETLSSLIEISDLSIQCHEDSSKMEDG